MNSFENRTMQSKKLRAFLESGINSLMPHAERVIELRQSLIKILPANLQRSCTIANYLQGKVVIFAENSAVAAKLRLMAPTLVQTLSNRVAQVTAIEVRVQPRSAPVHAGNDRELSPGAAETLRRLGYQLPDSKLKTAELKFAETNVKKG